MLGPLIAAFVSGEAFDVARRLRRAVILYLLAGTIGLIGIGFLIGAGYLVAVRRFGAIEAATGFGVVFLLIAILVVGVNALMDRRLARRAAGRRSVDMASIAAAAAVSLLPSLLRGKEGIAGIVWPMLAVLAYAIYRENVEQDGGDEPSE
jgi:hypothetical protein